MLRILALLGFVSVATLVFGKQALTICAALAVVAYVVRTSFAKG